MTITIPAWVLWVLGGVLSHALAHLTGRLYGYGAGYDTGVQFGDERASMRWAREHNGLKPCRPIPPPDEVEG